MMLAYSHFRQKMDAVPGIPTTLWFTPRYTTEKMKDITGNPNFVYEISCDQMCGSNHYGMMGVITVVSPEAYEIWLRGKETGVLYVHPEAAPAAPDTTANKATTAVLVNPK